MLIDAGDSRVGSTPWISDCQAHWRQSQAVTQVKDSSCVNCNTACRNGGIEDAEPALLTLAAAEENGMDAYMAWVHRPQKDTVYGSHYGTAILWGTARVLVSQR